MRKASLLFFGAIAGAGLTLLATPPHTLSVGSSAKAAASDIYRQHNLFGDVFRRVRADYVDKPDDRKLIESAINGMLAGLDPHSSYMDAKSLRDLEVQTRGKFGGLGIEVTMEDGLIKVVAPIDETPAAKAGIMANDVITELDGEAVHGLTLDQAVEKMRGPVHTKIKLTIMRKGQDKPIEVTIARDVIRVRSVRSHSQGDDYRLYPDYRVHRPNDQWPEEGDRRPHEADRRLQDQGLHYRPAQQSRRPARPGGLGFGAIPEQRRDRLHPGPQRAGNAALQRPVGRRPDQGQAAHPVDQRRIGVSVGNRRRRVAGPEARHADWHAVVRQRLGTDHHSARRRQRRAAVDHGALLHSVGPLHPGQRHHARY